VLQVGSTTTETWKIFFWRIKYLFILKMRLQKKLSYTWWLLILSLWNNKHNCIS